MRRGIRRCAINSWCQCTREETWRRGKTQQRSSLHSEKKALLTMSTAWSLYSLKWRSGGGICAYKRRNLAVKFMWLIRRLRLQPFPMIMALRLFLPGKVAAPLWTSILGTYGNYTPIVIFCFLFCFVCFIN